MALKHELYFCFYYLFYVPFSPSFSFSYSSFLYYLESICLSSLIWGDKWRCVFFLCTKVYTSYMTICLVSCRQQFGSGIISNVHFSFISYFIVWLVFFCQIGGGGRTFDGTFLIVIPLSLHSFINGRNCVMKLLVACHKI